jgi:hypothetical protein
MKLGRAYSYGRAGRASPDRRHQNQNGGPAQGRPPRRQGTDQGGKRDRPRPSFRREGQRGFDRRTDHHGQDPGGRESRHRGPAADCELIGLGRTRISTASRPRHPLFMETSRSFLNDTRFRAATVRERLPQVPTTILASRVSAHHQESGWADGVAICCSASKRFRNSAVASVSG